MIRTNPIPSVEELHRRYEYNPETGALRNRYKGRTLSTKHRRMVQIDKCILPSSRVIWKMMTGEDPEHVIDHANGDPTDERWCNLRAATWSQNNQNRHAHRRNSTGLKGVRRIPPRWRQGERFQACISVGGVFHYLGLFESAADAHAAYTEAATRLHGEFAFL
jgi:hypothetical protein